MSSDARLFTRVKLLLFTVLFSRGDGFSFFVFFFFVNSLQRAYPHDRNMCKDILYLFFNLQKKKLHRKKKKTLAHQLVPAAYQDGRCPHDYNITLGNSVFFGRVLGWSRIRTNKFTSSTSHIGRYIPSYTVGMVRK